ncbi:MAG: ABC transporter ATP-binding protein [Candidatus Lokiarchaeota archaeon]|nr:ABC transporter ATP-binding protein [Candidatus Lokiarchaeota archaeon]
MNESIIIETKNLTKYYNKIRGIENLDLKILKGEIFGLLGPNGAGKTTTIRVLLDLIRKTSGEAFIFGLDCHENSAEILQRVAYLPGELGLYKEKTARKNLDILLGMYKKPIPRRRIEELAERLRLNLNRKVEELSKGNKQKVGIILALAPEVDLLIADEPTSGLDPLIMSEFYKILYEQQKENETTALLSSHRLEEVERVAHRVGVIREGNIIELATVEKLKKLALKEVIIEFTNQKDLFEFKKKNPEYSEESRKNGLKETQIVFHVARNKLKNLLISLSQEDLRDLDIVSPALEELFLKYYEQKEDVK